MIHSAFYLLFILVSPFRWRLGQVESRGVRFDFKGIWLSVPRFQVDFVTGLTSGRQLSCADKRYVVQGV
jgi:hypothetical protein